MKKNRENAYDGMYIVESLVDWAYLMSIESLGDRKYVEILNELNSFMMMVYMCWYMLKFYVAMVVRCVQNCLKNELIM